MSQQQPKSTVSKKATVVMIAINAIAIMDGNIYAKVIAIAVLALSAVICQTILDRSIKEESPDSDLLKPL